MRQRVGSIRWGIAVLLGIGVVINYFDRTNISVATKPLMQAYHLTPGQMGILLSAFGWSYSFLQIPIGVILDKIGVKWLVRVTTILWSLATFMTAIVSGMGLILLSRVLLGAAEAPSFPSNAKAVGYWFPLKERGLATSAYDAAAKFSNVVGVPLVAFIVVEWGWRGGFYATAILSLLYAGAFWIWYRDPKEKRSLTESERQYIAEGGAQDEGSAPGGILRNLGYLLRNRKVWGLTIGFAAYDYAFYLFLTWLPGYLETQMHMTVLKTGLYTIIPWAFATVADLFAGWITDFFIKRGYHPSKTRKTLISIGMILGLAVIGATFTRNPGVAIVWITIALSGLSFAAPIGGSLPSIVAPKGTVGTVLSIMNFISNVMSILAPIVTGFIVGGSGSFAPAFIVAALVVLIGIFFYLVVMGEISPIQSPFINRTPDDQVRAGL
ncbi:MFS transporter [Alicyclobacillus acidoterrestris]|uniref:MFS transporter n=1 Tax=Alicyclobacillus acidoterrestris (strain ATCC 49025 / DSM 3922 / CIP 106132 / NCIMB 13137 / GD3B) TaxID=1356854 RepID=T0CAG8_ALIAG|nr:MFS transporter [Alicyclobacillus acidoterrestris]EPZ53113.1 hypothetical protein N007_18195 [Alicyclobacillus acidoterrestris ATCC 49025]UNO47688.1 MFS transporter [Alicyclobacillus acidoterrestris]